jgi:hypothetical protein
LLVELLLAVGRAWEVALWLLLLLQQLLRRQLLRNPCCRGARSRPVLWLLL